MFEKKEGFLIHASTGCTCCKSDNFLEGIFWTVDEAMDTVDQHRRVHTLSSQYSKTGVYNIIKVECEVLGDGRYIIDDRVFDEKFDTPAEHYFGGETILY